MKNQAIEGFLYRIHNRPEFDTKGDGPIQLVIPKNIDNSKLYAGSAMIFYCEHCGWPSDIKHEEHFLAAPVRCCRECEIMIKDGIMDEAKEQLKTQQKAG